MNKPPKTPELKRLANATIYSFWGLRAAFKSEAAFRTEVILFLILAPVVFLFPVTGIGKALLLSSLFFILIAELINTAIEAIVDRVSHEIHPLAKMAKDIGSAIVFLSLINMLCVWALVLWPVL